MRSCSTTASTAARSRAGCCGPGDADVACGQRVASGVVAHGRRPGRRPRHARVGADRAGRRGRHGLARDDRAVLVRSVDRATADHGVRDPVRAARRPGALAARAEDRREPGRVVVGVARRAGLRVQAASRAQVPQRRPADHRGREVQLRALQGGRRARDARAGAPGGDRRSARHPLPPQGALARLHDVLRHHRHRRRPGRAQEVHDAGRARRASASTRSAPGRTSS